MSARSRASGRAIAVRCIKTMGVFRFGRTYVAVPWASTAHEDGKGFLIGMTYRGGTTIVITDPKLFEPVDPDITNLRWRYWPVTARPLDSGAESPRFRMTPQPLPAPGATVASSEHFGWTDYSALEVAA